MAVPVRVHVYDLSMGMARVHSAALLGTEIPIVPHTGVVVYGREFYFSGGIQNDDPSFFATSRGIPVCRTIDLGDTEIPEEVFHEFLSERSSDFTATTYDLLRHVRARCAFCAYSTVTSAAVRARYVFRAYSTIASAAELRACCLAELQPFQRGGHAVPVRQEHRRRHPARAGDCDGLADWRDVRANVRSHRQRRPTACRTLDASTRDSSAAQRF